MTATPKVSIILPVYNVEPYLRQCLDTVIHQTVLDIQIICVNDGSTDGSLAILEEYAAKDSRFTIITTKNQGAGSARNTAFPHIKGEYTYFADPDDWLNLDLCEKALRRMEEINADVIYFRYFREYPNASAGPSRRFNPKLPDVRVTFEHRIDLLRRNAACFKFWRSEFLLQHQIRFSEGKRPSEDVIQNWKGCVLASRIAILDEPLYHYRRSRSDSSQNTLDRSHFVIVDTVREIETFLKETGKYTEYRNVFLLSKFRMFRHVYIILPNRYRGEFRTLILEALSEDDRHFLYTSPRRIVPRGIRFFYKMLEQQGIFSSTVLRFYGWLSWIERCLQSGFFNQWRRISR